MINPDYSTQYLGKQVLVIIDRPIGFCHPEWDLIYEVNYGYIPDTLAPDGEELDAYVLGVDKPVDKFEGKCIAIIQRLNDEDDKLVVVPDSVSLTLEQIKEMTNFQEKFFDIKIVMY